VRRKIYENDIETAAGTRLDTSKTFHPYRHALHATSGKLLGCYNPHLDQTFTALGRMVGHGNLMASLLGDLKQLDSALKRQPSTPFAV
jgi:hypothetical protein